LVAIVVHMDNISTCLLLLKSPVESLSQLGVLLNPPDYEGFTKFWKVVPGQVERLGHACRQVGARGLVCGSSEDSRQMPRINASGCSQRSKAQPTLGQETGHLLDERSHRALACHGKQYAPRDGRFSRPVRATSSPKSACSTSLERRHN
jgi:hypothetical protein